MQWGARKMNRRVLRGGEPSTMDVAWHAQLESWRNLLEACGQKPSRRRVHALRVATLRLLSKDLVPVDLSKDSSGRDAVEGWMKHAKKLRRTLSDVRALDVHRSRLASLRGSYDAPHAGRQHVSDEIVPQMDKLDASLKQRRRKAEKKLSDWIADQLPRLSAIAAEMEASTRVQRDRPPSQSVAEEIAALVADFPEPNVENLHDLRKRVKKARYITEAAGASEPESRMVLQILRSMQTAIGTWHDWDALAHEAPRILTGRCARMHLFPLLDEVAAEWLNKATEGCRRALGKLEGLGQRASSRTASQKSRKLPVRALAEMRAETGLRRA